MNDNPILKTSVIIVTKDRPEYLRHLLKSLTKQSLKPDEVIIIDNNSSKSYETVFDEFKNSLPLRTFVETNPGIPAARNRGLQEAKGDIILFTDDDCEADTQWIENLTKPFYKNPYIGMVGGEILSVKKSGGFVEEFCVSETLMQMGRNGNGYDN
ncbi:MAG: glycosyltransferase family A protein [Ignavibacteriaceae bacterium]|jgi:glycosyltransferase involved in cell wall biosynthesis